MVKNLKIGLFSLHSFSNPGGVKEHVLALYKEFKKRGLDTKIIVPRRNSSERYENQDIKFLGTSFSCPSNGAESDLTICFSPGSIERFLKKEKFDILHFHNFGLHSWQIAKKSRATNILTSHACIEPQRTKSFKMIVLLKIFQKAVNKRMDGIIGVAPLNLDIFKGFPGLKAVIPNGIDLNEFNPNVPKIGKYGDGKINILFVGRIEERKGLLYLLKAYKGLQERFKNLRLIVVGKGPLEQKCRNWVRVHQLKEVVFEGRVEGGKIPCYYATCDIFVSPATFGESFGIVLLEAMALRKPVVAFANLGYRGVLQGKGKEFLVEPEDWEGLTQKIEILIKNEEKRKEMGQWGLKESQKYSWDIIADQVLDFYQRVRE